MARKGLTEGSTGRSPKISIRLPISLLERLDEIAIETGRKRSDLIRSMIEEQVAA